MFWHSFFRPHLSILFIYADIFTLHTIQLDESGQFYPVSSVHLLFSNLKVSDPLTVTCAILIKSILCSCHRSYLICWPPLLCVFVLRHGKSVTTPSPSIRFVEAKHIDEWRQVFTLDALPSSLAQYLTTGLVHQLAITAWEEPDWSRLLLLLRLGVGHAGACECGKQLCVCVRDCVVSSCLRISSKD